jgi:O-antigen/teichoic acid export membrane protein
MSYSLKEVFKGGSIYIFGQILTKGSAFFLIPLYTAYLSPYDYGIIGYTQVFINIIFIVLMVSFHGSQTRYYYDNKNDLNELGSYLFSTNTFLFFISLIYSVIVLFWGDRLFSYIDTDIPYKPYIQVSLFIPVFMVFNRLAISFYLAKREYLKNVLLNIVQFLITTCFIVILIVWLDYDAYGYLLGTLFGNGIFLIIFYPLYAKRFKLKFSVKHVKNAIIFGSPLIFHLLSGNLHNMIDRVILEKYLSIADVGIYTLAFQIGMGITVLSTSFNQSFQPNFYELMASDISDNEKRQRIRKTYSFWVLILSSITIFATLFSSEFIILLTNTEYHKALSVTPFVMISSFFTGLYYFAVTPLFFYKKTNIIPLITFLSFILNLLLNLLLIPIYGMYGAVFSTIISHVFLTVVFYFTGRRLFNPNYDLRFTFLSIIFIFVALSSSFMDFSMASLIIKIVFLFVTLLILFRYVNSVYNIKFKHIIINIRKSE